MRIAQINKSTADSWDTEQIERLLEAVRTHGPPSLYTKSVEDSMELMFISSHQLSSKQIRELWEVGNFYAAGVEYWIGDTFEEILAKIARCRKHHDGV